MYRQGDVLLVKVDELPSGLRKKDNILAYGEATGHMHQFKSPSVAVYDGGDVQYAVLESEAILEHQEHDNLTIEKGIYEVRIQREVDLLQEVRQVMD